MTGTDLPNESVIGRVALRVNDLDAVASFYESVVGLESVEESGDRRVLGAGDTSLLVLIEDPDAPERGREEAGLFHTAFRVPSRAALGDALARVDERWELTGASDHHVSEALYLRDPEGNGVEMYHDRPRAEWPEDEDGHVEMDTLPLDLGELRSEASDDGATAPAGATQPGTVVGHVHLEVTDLAAARECYVEGFGFQVRQEMGASALFVAAGGYHHHVGLNTWNGRTEPLDGRGLAWFEVVLPDEDEVGAALDRCEAVGLTVRRGDPAEVVDPDGIPIRVRARRQ